VRSARLKRAAHALRRGRGDAADARDAHRDSPGPRPGRTARAAAAARRSG
jgi:hypothetical protein